MAWLPVTEVCEALDSGRDTRRRVLLGERLGNFVAEGFERACDIAVDIAADGKPTKRKARSVSSDSAKPELATSNDPCARRTVSHARDIASGQWQRGWH